MGPQAHSETQADICYVGCTWLKLMTGIYLKTSFTCFAHLVDDHPFKVRTCDVQVAMCKAVPGDGDAGPDMLRWLPTPQPAMRDMLPIAEPPGSRISASRLSTLILRTTVVKLRGVIDPKHSARLDLKGRPVLVICIRQDTITVPIPRAAALAQNF